FQAGVWSGGVVELQVSADGRSGLADRGVSVEVNLLVFDGLPDALDEDVVAPAAFAVHADADSVFLEPPGEGLAGELRALVGVEDLRFFIPGKGFFQRLDAEGSVQGDRQLPGQNPAAEPVHHR